MKPEHVGIFKRRVFESTGEREKAFAEQWEKENDQWHVLDLLLRADRPPNASPMSGFDDRPYHFGEPPTQRDATVAATVIQWLGSSVGRCFLEDSLARVGYRIVSK